MYSTIFHVRYGSDLTAKHYRLLVLVTSACHNETAMPALQHMPSAAEVALLLPHITTPVYTNSLTWVENKCSWHAWPSFKKGPLDSGYQG